MNMYFNVADFKAALGINWRGAFWKTLMYIGVDHKITSLIEAMHDNVECAIVISGQLTERIKMEIVVRQSCLLLHIMSSLFTEDFMTNLKCLCKEFTLDTNTSFNIRNADDTTSMSTTTVN